MTYFFIDWQFIDLESVIIMEDHITRCQMNISNLSYATTVNQCIYLFVLNTVLSALY